MNIKTLSIYLHVNMHQYVKEKILGYKTYGFICVKYNLYKNKKRHAQILKNLYLFLFGVLRKGGSPYQKGGYISMKGQKVCSEKGRFFLLK